MNEAQSEFLVPSAAPMPPMAEPVAPIDPRLTLEYREAEVARREQAIKDWVTAQREPIAKLTDATVESMIASEYAVCAFDAFAGQPNIAPDAERALRCVTLVVMILRNGFSITGSSACAAPENYDADTGRKEARAEALSKLWVCAEYASRNRLAGLDVVDYPDWNVGERPMGEVVRR